MKTDLDIARYNIDGFKPPVDVLVALHIVAPSPLQTIATATWTKPGHNGGVTWTVLATLDSGLALVSASSSDHWVQVDYGAHNSRPVDAAVVARLIPYADVTGIEVEISISEDGREFVYCDATWRVDLASEDSVSLAEGTALTGDGAGPAEFCQHLQSQLSAASVPILVKPTIRRPGS